MNIMNQNNDQIKKPEFMSDKMLQEELGVSRTTLWRYRKAQNNPLPSMVIKGVIYYRWSEVLRWIELDEWSLKQIMSVNQYGLDQAETPWNKTTELKNHHDIHTPITTIWSALNFMSPKNPLPLKASSSVLPSHSQLGSLSQRCRRGCQLQFFYS